MGGEMGGEVGGEFGGYACRTAKLPHSFITPPYLSYLSFLSGLPDLLMSFSLPHYPDLNLPLTYSRLVCPPVSAYLEIPIKPTQIANSIISGTY